jgi:CO/xanthine dehydrogenase Mo-binding subunit
MTIQRIGDPALRREDARFVTGQGAYLDDLKFERPAHAVVLRSPHAHALVRTIDTTAARSAPGVLAVLTAAEAMADGLKPLRPYAEANVQTGEPFAFAPQPLLATDKVRFAGEPVALIVAETQAQALDAAELVVVDFEPQPAVTTAEAARAQGAPLLSNEIPGNTCLDWQTGDIAGADAAFAAGGPRRLARRSATTVSSPTRWSRAARVGILRSRDRPLHAPRLQPEHPHQPQPSSPARSAPSRRTCASWRATSAAASAPRTSPMPSTR